MGIKNAEFDADFESVEIVAIRFMRKKLSEKKWQKNEDFEFFVCMQ